jgi:hypothetical protein
MFITTTIINSLIFFLVFYFFFYFSLFKLDVLSDFLNIYDAPDKIRKFNKKKIDLAVIATSTNNRFKIIKNGGSNLSNFKIC